MQVWTTSVTVLGLPILGSCAHGFAALDHWHLALPSPRGSTYEINDPDVSYDIVRSPSVGCRRPPLYDSYPSSLSISISGLNYSPADKVVVSNRWSLTCFVALPVRVQCQRSHRYENAAP
jgi:hypothetical protein